MWMALNDLYQNSNDHKKLALKDKLRKIKMEKGDSILNHDELGSVSITVPEDDMVILALPRLPKSFHCY